MNNQHTISINGYELGYEPDPVFQNMMDHVHKIALERRYAQIERLLVTHGADMERHRLVSYIDSDCQDSAACETMILVPKEMLGPDGLRDGMTMNDAKARFPWTQIKILITTGGKVR